MRSLRAFEKHMELVAEVREPAFSTYMHRECRVEWWFWLARIAGCYAGPFSCHRCLQVLQMRRRVGNSMGA